MRTVRNVLWALVCGRKATRRTRTDDLSFTKARGDSATNDDSRTCDGDSATPSSSPSSSGANPPLDDDLRRLMDAWPTLPEPLRAGILAIVKATSDQENG